MMFPVHSFRFIVAALAACMAMQQPLMAQQVLLRSGDTVEVRLGGVSLDEVTSVSGRYTVDSEGFLNLPHIGRVKAVGLSQNEIQTSIERKYIDGKIYTRPTITVAVPIAERFVNVGGEVRLPQRIPFTSDLTVLSAITAAGGFNEYASQGRVRLRRGNEVITVDVKKAKRKPELDVPLQPGDSIEVPRSLF